MVLLLNVFFLSSYIQETPKDKLSLCQVIMKLKIYFFQNS